MTPTPFPDFTPGPWQARFLYRMIKAARESPGSLVAAKPENDWADALLMAAAPDLLMACIAMMGTWGTQDEDAVVKARDMATAAIDKALGTT